ncbi:MAG: DNA polymerase III subunit delta [Chloroflexi bacterium]|nr:DNA polymerase III subunit delta [Chloroflexota bacterium]
MIYLLVGEDDFSIREALAQIKRSAGDETTLAANIAMLDGARVTPAELRNACETVPFLADKRLVIVEGLLGRFEPARGRKAERKTEVTARQQIADCLHHVPPFTTLALLEGKIGNRNPMMTQVTRLATVKTFPLLRGDALLQWTRQRARQAGNGISPAAADLLAKVVGSNLWVMANEIEKLALFARDRRIEEADVRAMVSHAQETNVFAMVDAIVARTGAAQGLVQQLLLQGATPAYLLTMLARQLHIVTRTKMLAAQGKSRAEIQSKLGLTSDFVLRKALEQGGKYDLARLKEVYRRLLETDLSIKTGGDPELAIDLLIAGLRY